MHLVGYTVLDEAVPCFVLPVFSSEPDCLENLFIQDIAHPRDIVSGFLSLGSCALSPFSRPKEFTVCVGGNALYGAKINESEVFIGGIEEFRSRIDTIDVNSLPASFKIQLNHLIGDSEFERRARQSFVKELIDSDALAKCKTFLASSISMSGWERTEKLLIDAPAHSAFLKNFRDIEFKISTDGKIFLVNNSLHAEIKALDLTAVVAGLQDDYDKPLADLTRASRSSHVRVKSETFVADNPELDLLGFSSFLNGFGRQEERLAIIFLAVIVFPRFREEILNYKDRAQTAQMGVNILKRRVNAIDGENILNEVRISINQTFRNWRSGDRDFFAAFLIKWFYPYSDYYNRILRDSYSGNLIYQRKVFEKFRQKEKVELVTLVDAIAAFERDGERFIWDYYREVDAKIFYF